ncbi:hypothetical protein LY76DRAFT_223851 [Colletotrichum caudatum]|nr:hypothetical protein LY76DRAFT_223851 [Colletotrichum caudatum]
MTSLLDCKPINVVENTTEGWGDSISSSWQMVSRGAFDRHSINILLPSNSREAWLKGEGKGDPEGLISIQAGPVASTLCLVRISCQPARFDTTYPQLWKKHRDCLQFPEGPRVCAVLKVTRLHFHLPSAPWERGALLHRSKHGRMSIATPGGCCGLCFTRGKNKQDKNRHTSVLSAVFPNNNYLLCLTVYGYYGVPVGPCEGQSCSST